MSNNKPKSGKHNVEHFLIQNPDWEKQDGLDAKKQYSVYIKGPYEIGYLPLSIKSKERSKYINNLLESGTPFLDFVPVDVNNIKFFEEMWTSKQSEFAIVSVGNQYVIYSKIYHERVRLQAPFLDEIVQNMIDAGVEILDEYPTDRLY